MLILILIEGFHSKLNFKSLIVSRHHCLFIIVNIGVNVLLGFPATNLSVIGDYTFKLL